MMLEAGKHEATVKSHFIDCTDSTGNWFVAIDFDVQGTELQGRIWLTGDPEKKEGRMRMARKSLKAIGFDPDTQNVKMLGEDSRLLAGKTCEVVVKEEEWKGETSLRIKYINSPPEPATDEFYDKITDGLRSVASAESKKKMEKGGEKLEDPPF